MYSGPKLNPN